MSKTKKNYSNTAVLVPCYNEEITVAKVVHDFRASLPGAKIYVYDNNSSDLTVEKATEAGAIVVPSPIQGKGNVVRQMFEEVEADVYVLVDGDDTYPAEVAPELIHELVSRRMDMVVGSRLEEYDKKSFRRFHKFGNRIITGLISVLFSVSIRDMLSGYRIFSRRFVKSIPLTSEGFEIETELTLQSVSKRQRIIEFPIHYRNRPEGSFSKLNTFSDGFLVLKSIFIIFRFYKPMLFFGILSILLALLSLWSGYRPVLEYLEGGFVYALPRAVLASGLGILSIFSLGIGLIQDTILRLHNEQFLLFNRLLDRRENTDKI